MRKYYYLLLVALTLSMNVVAWNQIPLTLDIIDDAPAGNGYPKSPIKSPTVYIENHTLSFVAGHPDYELIVKNENGEVVYYDEVCTSLIQVFLPSTLSGNYQIDLLMGNLKFTGYINI